MSGNRNAPFCFSFSFCLFKVHLPHVESRESEVVTEVSLKSEVPLLNSRPRLRLHKATIMVYSLCAIYDWFTWHDNVTLKTGCWKKYINSVLFISKTHLSVIFLTLTHLEMTALFINTFVGLYCPFRTARIVPVLRQWNIFDVKASLI